MTIINCKERRFIQLTVPQVHGHGTHIISALWRLHGRWHHSGRSGCENDTSCNKQEPRKAVQESGSLSTQGVIPSYQENYLNSFQGHSPVTWGPPTECHLLTSPHWGHVYSTHSFGGQTTRKPQQLPLLGFSISELCFQEVVCFPSFFDLLIFPNSKQPPTLGSELLESNYS